MNALTYTIIAPATPQGQSAIAIIRLSGVDSIQITDKIFKGKKLSKAKTHTIHYGFIVDGEKEIDEVMVSIFKAPRSFTTEDCVEISCHGSPQLVQSIISAAIKQGARSANPGEFTLTQKSLSTQDKLTQAVVELKEGAVKWGAWAQSEFQNVSRNTKILYVGLPLLILLLLVTGLLVTKRGANAPDKQVVVRYYPDAEQASMSSPGALTVKKADSSDTGTSVAKGSLKVDSSKKSDKPSIARVRTLEETTGAVAVMNLVVLPWGEVYLDGRMQGISPPLLELQVAPGKHEIEIRNANFPVYKQTIQAKVGEKIKIKHTFAN